MADESPTLESLIGTPARDEQGRFVSVTPAESPAEPVKPAESPPPPPEPIKAPDAPVVAAPPPAPVTPPEQTVPIKALKEEREKRQALERRLAELERPKEPQAEVDPWTDLPGALKSQKAEVETQLFVERCNLTEELARTKYKDFDEVREAFAEAANSNPALWQQIRSERNPAEFVYREGQKIRELGSVNGDITAYRAKLEKDIETRVRAEFEAKYAKSTPEVPASLNSDNSPATAGEVYQGPPSLKSILKNARS